VSVAGVPEGILPRRLRAPGPGWSTQADVVVVGSGIAGLTTALELRRQLRQRGTGAGRVLLVTKTVLDEGSTRWAQGGIAAALHPDDSPEEHLLDTLVAGADICDIDAVRILVTEGPQRVRELVALGTAFDRDDLGEIALTREGGHHRDRIAHAGGDATGLEIERALLEALHAVRDDPGIEVLEHALVTDLLTAADGRVCGVSLHVIGAGQRDGVGAALGRAVVLATGGIGQLWSATTNPSVATGDGVAAALRAGAELTDLEFVQFHPTVLWRGAGARGQQPLVSEAVRGEGAYLVDTEGTRFMPAVHPMAELAPRDVVAKAIVRQLRRTGAGHVWLDARHLGAAFLERRFPTILASARAYGVDPTVELMPVAPAQHYASGGIRTDLRGRSSIHGLYACGEVSCSGVHGANRLASNSLLEGLVFGHRIAVDIVDALVQGSLVPQADPVSRPGPEALVDDVHRTDLQVAMTAGAGVLRSAASLAAASEDLARIARQPAGVPTTESWETTNLHQVATMLCGVAQARQESRGGHSREDFPDPGAAWRGHLVSALDADGCMQTRYEPLGAPRATAQVLA
jgi:L-aspartate oxidase